MATLTEAAIHARLQRLPGWSLNGANIERKYTFESFLPAIGFVNRVAQAAEAAGHHPDITINYNRVTLALSSHSEGGITEKDFDLAGQFDNLEHA